MFKVADYLVQSQAAQTPPSAAQLRPLDSRGAGSAAFSMGVLLKALGKIAYGRMTGRLAGVHVNMAEKLSLFRKSAIIVACCLLGVPVVLHLHAQMYQYYGTLPGPLKRLTRWVFSLPQSVVVIGPAARRFVTEELHAPGERVAVVPNGVPEATHQRLAPHANDPQQVLFLGNLSERKGVTNLLKALSHPGFRTLRLEVTFAGGGDVPGYQAKARELGIDGFVRFAGWCDQEAAGRLLARADVLVLPSNDEVMPLVILEALANGVAVVCTAVGEIPSFLADGVNACFVRPGDIDELAITLQKVLRQPELMDTLSHNGRLLYEQQFSLPQFFSRIARIHQGVFGISAQPIEGPPPVQRGKPFSTGSLRAPT